MRQGKWNSVLPSCHAAEALVSIVIPSNIETTYQGFQKIARLYHESLAAEDKSIVFDFSSAKYIDSNMCSCLGAIIELLRNKIGKTLCVEPGARSSVNMSLSKNGFFNAFSKKKLLEDRFGTIIDYQKFSLSGSDAFQSYVRSFFSKENA